MNPRSADQRWRLFDDAARLRSVLDASPDAIIAKDLDGTITDWNRAAEVIYGWPAEAAIGQHIHLIVPEDRRAEVATILERVRRGETVRDIHTTRVHRDGHDIAVVVAVAPLHDRFDRLKGASIVTCRQPRDTELRAQLAQHLGAALDTTAKDTTPARLRAAIEHLRDDLQSETR